MTTHLSPPHVSGLCGFMSAGVFRHRTPLSHKETCSYKLSFSNKRKWRLKTLSDSIPQILSFLEKHLCWNPWLHFLSQDQLGYQTNVVSTIGSTNQLTKWSLFGKRNNKSHFNARSLWKIYFIPHMTLNVKVFLKHMICPPKTWT